MKYENFRENILPAEEYDLLFNTARAIQEEDMETIQKLYQHPLLRVSNPMWSFSPALNPKERPKKFELLLNKND